MADLTRRLASARRALATLIELEDAAPGKILRDASIQRFEYTVEAIWKAAQAVLREHFGVESSSPKPVVRASFENGLLTEDEARLALAMIDHRNLTAHTYNESLADEIFAAIPAYRAVLSSWLGHLEEK